MAVVASRDDANFKLAQAGVSILAAEKVYEVTKAKVEKLQIDVDYFTILAMIEQGVI